MRIRNLSRFEKISLSLTTLALVLRFPFLRLRFGPVECFERFSRPTNQHFPITRTSDIIETCDRILLVRIFGKLLFRTRCLKRTFVLFVILRRAGYDARAVLGYTKDQNGISGHAWLLVDGVRVDDPVFTPKREFIPFIEIGSETRRLKNA